jgi:hypothetical protein
VRRPGVGVIRRESQRTAKFCFRSLPIKISDLKQITLGIVRRREIWGEGERTGGRFTRIRKCRLYPSMERRIFATCQKVWPEMKVYITSPEMDFSEQLSIASPV